MQKSLTRNIVFFLSVNDFDRKNNFKTIKVQTKNWFIKWKFIAAETANKEKFLMALMTLLDY